MMFSENSGNLGDVYYHNYVEKNVECEVNCVDDTSLIALVNPRNKIVWVYPFALAMEKCKWSSAPGHYNKHMMLEETVLIDRLYHRNPF